MYDGRVGRWMTTDPYSQYHSPYLAMRNDPINLIDPDGGFAFGGPDNPKPTVITIRYEYTVNSSNIPFVEIYRSITGTFTKLTKRSITNISFGDTDGGYQVNIETPRVYPHNRDNPSYTTQIYISDDLDNLEEVNNSSMASAFTDGFKVGVSTALVDEVVNAGVLSAYKLPSRFKVLPAQKQKGIRFRDPKNAQSEVRIMKGNPNSPHVSQQSAYIKYKHNGTFYDVKGNPIKSAAGGGKSDAAHIPLKNFDPSVMPKFD
jgi:hypothetical protein